VSSVADQSMASQRCWNLPALSVSFAAPSAEHPTRTSTVDVSKCSKSSTESV